MLLLISRHINRANSRKRDFTNLNTRLKEIYLGLIYKGITVCIIVIINCEYTRIKNNSKPF